MTLVLAGTPIGCADDASPRLAAELARADVVAAEDTRRLRRLAADIGADVRGQVVSYFDGNERERTPVLLAALQEGQRVVLVTDAGMPSVSDPGYRLVAAAVDAGLPVTVVPGPSAVLAALAVSGLPADRFCFEGFLPRKAGERARRLESLAGDQRTLVFFEAPHRTGVTLTAMAQAFGGDRKAAVCRELTKTYEEVRREVTIVVAGLDDTGREVPDAEKLRTLVDEAVSGGLSRKDAVIAVAEQTGLPRRAVYQAGHR